jgi:Zn-dependent protease
MATRFGDDTPRQYGRLTLNPLAPLDPIGSLLLLIAGFGWAKPVPVNPYVIQRRSQAGLMWVSLAGPGSNFLMAILAAIPFRMGLYSLNTALSTQSGFLPTFPFILAEFIIINLLLMLFNLIPLAPLDGEKIADYFFPPPLDRWLEKIRPYGPIILLVIAVGGPLVGLDIIGWIIEPPLYFLLSLLAG